MNEPHEVEAASSRRDQVEEILGRLARRQRLLWTVRDGLRGLFYGTAIAAAAIAACLIAGRFVEFERPLFLLAAIPLAGTVGALIGGLRKMDRLALARVLDRSAGSEDRFASALQLLDHHRRERVDLIVDNALARVAGMQPAAVLPLAMPRELRWLPAAAVGLAVLFLFDLSRGTAVAEPPPEVSSEQWQQLEEHLREEMERKFKDPRSELEKEIAAEFHRLKQELAEQPRKKEALAQLAALRTKLEKKREQLESRDVDLRKAALSLQKSEMLEKLAEQLKLGNFRKAAEELQRLSKELKDQKLNLSAEQLEKLAEDFERLADELKKHEELEQACRECANAASLLKQDELAEALQKLSKTLEENNEDLEQNDSLCRACESLDGLEQMLAKMKSQQQCPVCNGENPGSCSACNGSGMKQGFVQKPGGQGAKKGGLKAGRGTAANWAGGGLTKEAERRVAVTVPDENKQGPGVNVSRTVSTDERAQSALSEKEKFAKMIEKSEADLELEDVPASYREYLRRYFNAIKPQEEAADGKLE